MDIKNFKDYYQILGITKDATDDEIRRAYKKCAKKYHPDANRDKDEKTIKKLEENFIEVRSIYEILKNKEERLKYDKLYDAYQLKKEEERKEKERKEKERVKYYQKQQATNKTRKNTRTNKSEEEITFDDLKKEMKKTYRRVREEENSYKETEGYRVLDQEIYQKYGQDVNDFKGYVCFQILRGSVHVSKAFLHQFNNLRRKEGDSRAKYILRNRKLILTTLSLFTMIILNFVSNSTPKETPIVTEDQQTEVKPENKDVLLNHIYTILPGDTLSEIAEANEVSVEKIKRDNRLINDVIYAGDQLKIKYRINKKDVCNCTEEVSMNKDMTLNDVAILNDTDLLTILNLNDDNILIINGELRTAKEKVLVPNFDEVKTLENEKTDKGKTKVYSSDNKY